MHGVHVVGGSNPLAPTILNMALTPKDNSFTLCFFSLVTPLVTLMNKLLVWIKALLSYLVDSGMGCGVSKLPVMTPVYFESWY